MDGEEWRAGNSTGDQGAMVVVVVREDEEENKRWGEKGERGGGRGPKILERGGKGLS